MRPIYWAIVTAALILIVGIIFGVAGIFLAPILGAVGLVVLIVWLVQRAARDKPPIK
jgi:predicted PurR-regulated permease PerM